MHVTPFRQENSIKSHLPSIHHFLSETCLSFRKPPDPKRFHYQREKEVIIKHQREDITDITMAFLSFRKPPDPQYENLK